MEPLKCISTVHQTRVHETRVSTMNKSGDKNWPIADLFCSAVYISSLLHQISLVFSSIFSSKCSNYLSNRSFHPMHLPPVQHVLSLLPTMKLALVECWSKFSSNVAPPAPRQPFSVLSILFQSYCSLLPPMLMWCRKCSKLSTLRRYSICCHPTLRKSSKSPPDSRAPCGINRRRVKTMPLRVPYLRAHLNKNIVI